MVSGGWVKIMKKPWVMVMKNDIPPVNSQTLHLPSPSSSSDTARSSPVICSARPRRPASGERGGRRYPPADHSHRHTTDAPRGTPLSPYATPPRSLAAQHCRGRPRTVSASPALIRGTAADRAGSEFRRRGRAFVALKFIIVSSIHLTFRNKSGVF